ncbi:MAG: hypothetical protein LLG01_08330 [Planctomycetaceae bacterium]|nr:hypothetical protein [Planctomycetaceae bacterium]
MMMTDQEQEMSSQPAAPPGPRWTVVTPRLAGHMALWMGLAACIAMLVPAALCPESLDLALILALIGIGAAVASLITSRDSGARLRLRLIGMLICALPLGVITAMIVIGPPETGHSRQYCLLNLKWIGVAMREYHRTDQKQPRQMSDLIRSGLVAPTAYKCPYDSGWKEGQSSYFFFLPPKEDEGAVLIACDLNAHPRGGRSVLTAEGLSFFLKDSDFQERLARPENAAFAAALRAFEATGAKSFPLDRPLAASRPAP